MLAHKILLNKDVEMNYSAIQDEFLAERGIIWSKRETVSV